MAVILLAIAVLAWHLSPARNSGPISPRVFCMVENKPVATALTMNDIIGMLRQEHGTAEVLDKGETLDIRTPKVLMEFRKHGRSDMLLTDITILETFAHPTPSKFLGL
jgi:hypothetical protein